MPSQWGPVHLFDLCLWFGHVDTALELAKQGVKGCKLEEHHLATLPDARDAIHLPRSPCDCNGWECWETCSCCCWGFPVDNGVWMKDWDAPLDSGARLNDAARAAKQAAKTPLVSEILEIFSRDQTLSFAMSDEAAARLLDIAILCGNSQAAGNLAQTFSVRPLRRWWGDDLRDRDDLPVLSTALLAGADFQRLHMHESGVEVPLLQFVALDFDSEDWQQLGHFVSSMPRWPSREVRVGEMFLSREIREDATFHYWISTRKVRNALRAGCDLKYISILFVARKHAAGLLDLAILGGNSACADALATAGVELHEDCLELLKRAYRGENVKLHDLPDDDLRRDDDRFHVGSALECQSAASAAARASLRKSFKREASEKGVAVYQVLTNKFYPRDVPMALVHDILGFSMETPKISDQLDLWDKVRGWISSL